MVDDSAPGSKRDVTRQLGFLLRVAQGAVWRDLVATFAAFEIKPQQYAALTTIERSAGVTLDVLAKALRMKSPNLVAMIDDLDTRELIQRRRDGKGGRGKKLELTGKGEELLRRLKAADEGHERALVHTIGRERMQLLLHDLAILADFSSQSSVADAGEQGARAATDVRVADRPAAYQGCAGRTVRITRR